MTSTVVTFTYFTIGVLCQNVGEENQGANRDVSSSAAQPDQRQLQQRRQQRAPRHAGLHRCPQRRLWVHRNFRSYKGGVLPFQVS